MTYTYKTDADREVAFASEAAYEAAVTWYNDPSNSKTALLNDYAARMDDGAIYADADCTKLTSDWADLCMAAWANDTQAAAPFVWR